LIFRALLKEENQGQKQNLRLMLYLKVSFSDIFDRKIYLAHNI